MTRFFQVLSLALAAGLFAVLTAAGARAQSEIAPGTPGSEETPLRVMLVPTDGGTEDGTRADFAPIFNAVSRTTGLQFEIRVGQSYASVVEGMVNGLVDIAFVGPTLYLQAAARGAAEPLAVAVLNGESVYYAAFFARNGFELKQLGDMKGRSMAFGDVNSSSSFTIQVGMLIEAGVDPARDLSRVFLTGGHANSLNALAQGHVDVSAASLNSYQKAVNEGAIDAAKIVPVAVSVPIPYPPFIMLPSLPGDVKARLRAGFDTVHEDPAITPEMIRGFGGILVDRYSSDITHETFEAVQRMLDLVTPEVKGEMLKKASEN
ncbi:MAG: phosphate/phosphite/phosphonate ABC transporter substrate-binding protein [Rhodobacteraceae bacterium]|nr:phosphate/phosphite/phosphonate ABC transporter substrate-binding protein [Paracoccaceae bacterium]